MSQSNAESDEEQHGSDEIVKAECDEPALLKQADSLMEDRDQLADMLAANALAPSRGEPDLIGHQIGPYVLREKLGEGGFGIVYIAEQSEPVKRKVAVKVIKRGMDSDAIIRRFEAERQTLAMMDHPNIATVLDVGTTEDGRPYFAMELVHGLPITDYCDQEKLDLPARLALFLDVCAAMQHAHQKGIIHRDIKPSNILVTVREDRPVVKMIDFGIAKALEFDPEQGSMLTTHGQLIGTPHYMSPEQARGGGAQIDTRSDIYGLGVVLYELLTSATPINRDRFRQAGLAEVQRIIVEQEPLKPSSQVLTLKPASATKIMETRGQSQRETGQALRGDLDWVLMRALEKEPDRRYPSASSFAEDIQRHLRNEPVQAGPPSRLYAFGKLVRRNRLAFAFSALVLVLLVAGVSVSTHLYLKERETAAAERRAREETADALVQAEEAKQRAEAAQRRARADQKRAEGALAHSENETARLRSVSHFLRVDLLENSINYSGRNGDVKLLEALNSAAALIETRFAGQPYIQAEVHTIMATAYRWFEEYQKSLRHLRMADEILERVAPLGHEMRSGVDLKLGWVLIKLGESQRAEELILETLKTIEAHSGSTHPQFLGGQQFLALAYQAQGRHEEAVRLAEKIIPTMRTRLGEEHWLTLVTMNQSAFSQAELGRFEPAIKLMESAIRLNVKALGESDRKTLGFRQDLADIYRRGERARDAFALHRKVFDLSVPAFGLRHRITQRSVRAMVELCEQEGAAAKAKEWREKLVE